MVTLEGYEESTFTAEGKTKTVFRTGSGPAVVVISEVPGITPLVAAFGRRVADRGLSVVLPRLFGEPGAPASAGALAKTMASVCVSREFTLLALRKTSPVVSWLRALAQAEHDRCGGPGVGAVGMCLTGGFALGMMVDDWVVAPVLSQPSLPLPLSKARAADLGLSDADLARVRERVAEGTTVLGLRFSNDPACRPARFEHLRQELGERVHRGGARLVTRQPLRAPQERPLRADRAPRRQGGHADTGRPRPGPRVLRHPPAPGLSTANRAIQPIGQPSR